MCNMVKCKGKLKGKLAHNSNDDISFIEIKQLHSVKYRQIITKENISK